MQYITSDLYYDVLDPFWDEAVRLVSWFALPVLLYIAVPLLVLSLVLSRERLFKTMLALTLLVATPTALYWNYIGAMRIFFYRHYRSAPPPAPSKRHRVRFAEPDGYIVCCPLTQRQVWPFYTPYPRETGY